MAQPSVRFELGDFDWIAERDSVGFVGETEFGFVDFLITTEALIELLNPDLDGVRATTGRRVEAVVL